MSKVVSIFNQSHSACLNNKRGFSLIEIIVVIVILGVLATGISTFISFSTQIYTDATDRDKVVSSSRFAIERLNREIRLAVPNSIRVTTNGFTGANAKQCVEFTPIVLSTIYTDIAVIPEPATADINVIAFDETLFKDGFNPSLKVGVYILDTNEFYGGTSGKVFTLQDNAISTSGNEWTIKLASAQTFFADSPTNRLYFFNQSVSYCVQSSQLRRHQNYTRNADDTPDSDGVLMAENIDMFDDSLPPVIKPPFKVENATLLRNSMVLVKLTFNPNNESIVFNNEIQVPNVP
ncbi:MAG: prepilin-type N-terminal cleavage/methylation domain-containing protein [Colwellia sp.]|nr:prepilin-type N-terminal cleavage/methylation domain-containing protein [Colwellia sp.]